MTANEAQCRVKFSEELLQVVRHAKRQTSNIYELAMSHGSIISTPMIRVRFYRGQSSDSKITENSGQKSLVSIIWSTFGIHSFLILPAGMRYDAEIFVASVLPDIERNLCDGNRRKMLRGVYLHLDSASAHHTKRSRQEIVRTKATRVVHSAYFPDVALSDFFLFGYLKGEMAGFTANSHPDILSEIRRIFQEISKETLVAVYDEWTTRIE
jgi:hypothetical protein